ncbi:DUF2254 domain-containing protein [Microvirga splendida]|uniref:DUF2254 domain-containing protein n=1 Tax=Microvirga splendida TaxID=2795727 RepID=A0ABS0Y3W6_9HYPH|nr:DUF2254 domain-containing protein [Microvirga splendida]MBJ6127001.1 DUF2254 domain-containing protein [Microvirga splendida]
MTRIRNILVRIRGQLWILPALMCVGALLLAYLMLSPALGFEYLVEAELWWLFSGDAGTARDLLSTLLSGMMTMTSLVVSMTFITLTLAANQLGPRLIWNFIEDRQIQAVLGLFLATIFYIVVVLRSIDDTLGPQNVPHLAITTATVLTLVCLFSLLFYVHKVSRAIIADTVVERVADALQQSLDDLLSNEEKPAAEHSVADLPAHVCWISIGKAGYIQTIDYGQLVHVAKKHDIVLRVTARAGHFLLHSGKHVEVLSCHAVEEDLSGKIRPAFIIGQERNAAQDLEYSFRQLVEVALRALSSGIKDPFTVIAVVDHLGKALELLLMKAPQEPNIYDDEGQLRVIASLSDAEGLVEASFNQIRQSASDQPAILIHIADTLRRLAEAVDTTRVQDVLLQQLDGLAQSAEGLAFRHDREETFRRIAAARKFVRRS